jgi:predicted dehydrogenase
VRYGLLRVAALAAALGWAGTGLWGQAMQTVRFMTLDPGHFHAALVQKDMYPNVSPKVDVYAPLGPDLLGHLARVSAFNLRPEKPTSWQLEVHTGPDFFERMLKEKPGNVVVISGRNNGKIDRVSKSVGAGLNVLVDKPWILKSADLPKLDAVLAEADSKGLVAYDIMTERFEVTTILQKELVNDHATFGEPVAGTPAEPGVYMESIHYLMKVVSGAPNIRPAWFFDTAEQGEGLNDIGTHLVDLVQWTLFPAKAIDYKKDVHVLSASRWPTVIPENDFKRVTGEAKFPASLAPHIKNGSLDYDCNTLVTYSVNGIHTTLNVIWDWEAPQGSGDRHFASYRGGLSRVEVRQTKADSYRPEVYVVPNKPEDKAKVLAAVKAKIAALQGTWPGTAAEEHGAEIRLVIPDKFRVGHEAHFAQVTGHFLQYLGDRKTLPAWERPNMLAKYYVTTTGTEMSHQGAIKTSTRRAPE